MSWSGKILSLVRLSMLRRQPPVQFQYLLGFAAQFPDQCCHFLSKKRNPSFRLKFATLLPITRSQIIEKLSDLFAPQP
jgi:hypothetical protein